MKRPRIWFARAAMRLALEELVPITTIASELGITKENIRRWGRQGKRGIYLDVIHRTGEVYYTSRPALKRFLEAQLAAERERARNAGLELSPTPSTIRLAPAQRDILLAIQRVNTDGLISAAILAGELGILESELVGWIVEDLQNHFLDSAYLGQAGWFTSRQSVERFLEDSNSDHQQTNSVEMVPVEAT